MLLRARVSIDPSIASALTRFHCFLFDLCVTFLIPIQGVLSDRIYVIKIVDQNVENAWSNPHLKGWIDAALTTSFGRSFQVFIYISIVKRFRLYASNSILCKIIIAEYFTYRYSVQSESQSVHFYRVRFHILQI